ncbi:DHHA1 domain-containing protein [Amedibacillus sp. YH-ame6]
MTNKLYDNCFTTELSTKVVKVEEENGCYWHACKDTIFYKEGGGMASDIGMINEHMVLDLKYKDGYLWHLLDVELEGNVFMSVNLHERFRKCQVHTAQHLISAVLGNVYKVNTLAHHTGDDENDIEFDFEEFTDKMAFELQVLCNGLIRDDLEVTVQYPTPSEAKRLAIKGDVNRDDVRVVRIGALDYNLCGCLHVPSLRYLQMLYISGFEKTTNGYKVKYLVGDQFLDCVSRRYQVLDEVSRTLAVPHLYVGTGVNRIINENKQLNRDVVVWKQKYYEMFGRELAESDEEVIVQGFDDIDVKSLAAMAQFITSNYKKAVIFVAKVYDNVHVVVASNKELAFDSEKTFKEISEKYHLRGGGNKQLSQGGGIYNEEILTFVKTYSVS